MKKECKCDNCLFLLNIKRKNVKKIKNKYYCMYPLINEIIVKNTNECEYYLPYKIK